MACLYASLQALRYPRACLSLEIPDLESSPSFISRALPDVSALAAMHLRKKRSHRVILSSMVLLSSSAITDLNLFVISRASSSLSSPRFSCDDGNCLAMAFRSVVTRIAPASSGTSSRVGVMKGDNDESLKDCELVWLYRRRGKFDELTSGCASVGLKSYAFRSDSRLHQCTIFDHESPQATS